MFRLRDVPIVVPIIVVVVVLTLPSAIRAQAIAPKSGPPQDCSKRDLEIHFGFF